MCLRRRFYTSPVTSVAAGMKKRLLFHRGKFCIKQLSLRYIANSDTGSWNNIWIIKIDGQEILNMKLYDICNYIAGSLVAYHSDRPVVLTAFDSTNNIYGLMLHDLGRVDEGIEVWLKNVDTSNACGVWTGMVYDIIE